MSNKELARKMDNFIPWYEKETTNNSYKMILNELNNATMDTLQSMYDFFCDYEQCETTTIILKELKNRMEIKK